MKKQYTKYPAGMKEFIRGIANGKSSEEIAKAVSMHFRIEFSVSQCRTYKYNHNIVERNTKTAF